MWLSRVSYCALSLTCVLAVAGCGGSGFNGQGSSDSLTMSFQSFSGEGLMQQDVVSNTSASVDLCQTICSIMGDIFFPTVVLEDFTPTMANALFINQGFSDILLDHYTVTIVGRPDIPTTTVQTAALLPGGTCSSLPNKHCGNDGDCGIAGPCVHPETTVEIVLYDLVTKDLIRPETQHCPQLTEDDQGNLIVINGDVTPVSYQTNVTFYGSDETGESFVVKTGLRGNFSDANNCVAAGA